MRIMDGFGRAVWRVREFLSRDIWQIEPPGTSRRRGFVMKHARVLLLLVSNLVKNALLLRASALAFSTLLAVVPFLALMFFVIETFNLDKELYDYIAKTLGMFEVAQVNAELPDTLNSRDEFRRAVAQFFLRIDPGEENPAEESPPSEGNKPLVNPVTQEALENPIETIIDYARKGDDPQTIGLVGVIFIITTVFGLMMNIESSFNQIWGIRDTRTWYRMISDYVMVVLLLPFVVAVMVILTAVLQSMHLPLGEAIVYRTAQIAAIWFCFAMLYYLVPNTTVKIRYALLGGIVGGTLWNMLNWVYITFQYGLDRYSIFYSALAQIPVLLMWVYFSWVVLLFGAELAYAYQHEKVFMLERLASKASFAYREALGVRTMIEVARRFTQGGGGLDPVSAARDWNVPLRLLNEVLYDFEQSHLVVRLATNPPTYQPGRPTDQITVANVIAALRESGVDPTPLRFDPEFRGLFERLAKGNGFLGVPLSELAQESGWPLPPSAQLEYRPPAQELPPPGDAGSDSDDQEAV